MAGFYSEDNEFENLDVKKQKQKIKEDNTSYEVRLLMDIFRFIARIVGYILFIIFKTIKWVCLSTLIIGVTIGAIVATDFIPKLNEYSNEAKYEIKSKPIGDAIKTEPSYIYDSNNSLIVKLSSGEENKQISYDELPQSVIDAMVSVEDRTFFNHYGIDLKGIIRVLYNFAESDGEDKTGASTITQQLMRSYYITREVTLDRKLKEICYSLEYEEIYNKKQIFEQYINNIYFGNGYYGIETAAYGYFNKSIKECSLTEIAYLCALPNRPNYFNPYGNKYNAYSRRNKILEDMAELGYITQDECEKAKREEIEVTKREEDNFTNRFTNSFSSYATYCAVEELMKLDGFSFEYEWDSMDDYNEYKDKYNEEYEIYLEKLKNGGYKIYTSLDKDAQEILQDALDKKLSLIDNTIGEDGLYKLQGSITCIDNDTNLVIAILSGREQDDVVSYYNRGFQAYRQPGSSIKPLIIYTPALCAGFNKNSTLKNIDIKKFKETGEQVGSDYTLENSVIWSRNGCAYYLLNMIGPKTGLSYLKEMEFNRVVPDDYYLSSALGGLTYGVTTAEMASAYNCIYNKGNFKHNSCIKEISDDNGIIYKYTDDASKKVYSNESCTAMIEIMENVIKEGTARSMKWDYNICSAAGKTGTTNDNKDGWFCGITPYYSMAVWIGYDNPKTLTNLQGGTYPSEVWKDAMESLIVNKIENGEKPVSKKWNNLEVYNTIVDIDDTSELLPGRSDDELLSDGYTVGDYRNDYSMASEAYEIIESMGDTRDEDKIQQVKNIISNIKGVTCKKNVEDRLDEFMSSTEENTDNVFYYFNNENDEENNELEDSSTNENESTTENGIETINIVQ